MNYSISLLTKRIIYILQFCCLLILTACATDDPEKNSSDTCFEGVVVRDRSNSCDFIVQIKNGKLGEDWDNLKNCVHIKNLPLENQKLGSVIYFRDYKSADGQICITLYLGLPRSITIENYASSGCP